MATNKCKVCSKSVYPMDPQINLDGSLFHKVCAKCTDCNCQITLSNFTKNETDGAVTLLCKTHYFKRFHEQGSYLGGDKFQVKNPRDERAGSAPVPSAGSSAADSSSPTTAEPTYAGVKLKSTPRSEPDTETAPTAASIDSITDATDSVRIQDSMPAAPAPTPEPTLESDEVAAEAATLSDAAVAELAPPTPPAEEEGVTAEEEGVTAEPEKETTTEETVVGEETVNTD
jgi:hypothetical protein